MSEAVLNFARAILHGDDEHRAWLMAAAEAFVAGETLPPVAGSGAISRLTAEREGLAKRVAELERIVSPGDACPDCMGVALHFRGQRDAMAKALEKIRDDNYPPSDLDIMDCKQPEMIWQSVARRALATLRVTDAERQGGQG